MAENLPPNNTTESVNSPNSHRKSLPSPWAQVVRGEKVSSSSSSSSPEKPTSSGRADDKTQQVAAAGAPTAAEGSDDNASGTKKSVWIKPVNGVVAAAPVIGDGWPTITESTRLSVKSSDSSKPDASISNSQVHVPQKQADKQGNQNGNDKLSSHHKHPGRQKAVKRGGGGAGHSGFNRPTPPPPTPPPFPLQFTLVQSMMEPYKGSIPEIKPTVGVGPHLHSGNDHSSQRHSSRRGNFSSRPRDDGLHYNGHGGRRDQDRDWSGPRNSTARDIRMNQMAPPPPPPPRFVRPGIPGSMPFLPPHHVRPYGNPMPTVDFVTPFMYIPPLPPESLRGVPLIPPPLPPMFFPVVDPNLPTMVVNQIDYYFSDANLVKDEFLRSNMDEEGWVHIGLIANFPRVLSLTSNVQLILDALGASTVVEVQGEKIRKRENWKKWIPPSSQVHPDSALPFISESTDKMLATSIQKVSLDEANTTKNNTIEAVDAHTEVVSGDFSSKARTAQSKVDNGEDNAAEVHD